MARPTRHLTFTYLQVEKINRSAKQLSKMSKKQKLQLLVSEAPELFGLLTEFKVRELALA
jgi:hypothetical protein